ncbi:MAG: hypothetical protein JXR44_08055 [Thiotrichales bacterium]|nr:hypothetical protein [Thiotrichales bacterium]
MRTTLSIALGVLFLPYAFADNPANTPIKWSGFSFEAHADQQPAHSSHAAVSDQVIAQQHQALIQNTQGKGFGPQAPRDLSQVDGSNSVEFQTAPPYQKMNLCNIHFHENAEHKGGEFTTYAGNGDGHGYNSGFKYSGTLTPQEATPIAGEVCKGKHGGLQVGDTVELHYVHTTAMVNPGPTLGSCLSKSIGNPQLRVEAQVYVLVNDKNALDFNKLTEFGVKEGYQQAFNIPQNTGTPILYSGSTTGPKYNEQGSPFQVTWSVRPKVAKVDIATVGEWCKGNAFQEDHAHGVRNLVIEPELLSKIHP